MTEILIEAQAGMHDILSYSVNGRYKNLDR